MNELEIFEAYMKKEHPFIDVKSEAYAAMRNLWQARVPEGYVVVPKEPSDKMIEIGKKYHSYNEFEDDVVDIYKSMIEAVEK